MQKGFPNREISCHISFVPTSNIFRYLTATAQMAHVILCYKHEKMGVRNNYFLTRTSFIFFRRQHLSSKVLFRPLNKKGDEKGVRGWGGGRLLKELHLCIYRRRDS